MKSKAMGAESMAFLLQGHGNLHGLFNFKIKNRKEMKE